MPSHLVDGTDLKQWADRIEASAILPRLLRRLITATASGIERISFPADDAILLGGWDGTLNVLTGNEYVPDGLSVWELGRNTDVKGKADSDYDKRKTNTLAQDASEIVFVFVTPRRWGGKENWVNSRCAEKFWKDVRAYDADDLTAWLEIAPAVHVWLSILLGKRPERASDITRWWSEWAEVTAPPLSHNLITAGRQQAADQVLQWLRGDPTAIGVQADSQEEALAFLAAVVLSLPSDEKDSYLSRALVVEDRTSWLRVALPGKPLILIPHFDDRDGAASAVKDGHHVFVPLGRSDARLADAIDLQRLRYEPLRSALSAMGVPAEKVGQLASLARRSMMSLRRYLAVSPAVRTPAWAAPAEALPLRAPLLVGNWRDDLDGDRAAVEKIAGRPYPEVSGTFLRWEREADSPIKRTGPAWVLSSKEDAWPLLAGFLDRDMLSRFEDVAVEAFGEINPIYDLPADERWMGLTKGKALSQSELYRKGVADTLALAASQSEIVRLGGNLTGQELASRIVYRILRGHPLDWKVWASLSPVLPLLAEASPNEFLSAVEEGLATDAGQFSQLFSDVQAATFGGTPHTGLLWALENLAWNPDLLARVTMALAKLAMADPNPKSNHANRPAGSLRDIFLAWMPQTTANVDRRLRVIDGLRQREGQVAWDVMRAILPTRNGYLMPNHRPRYREWAPDETVGATTVEVWKFTSEVVRKMVTDAGSDGFRWSNLVDSLSALPETLRDTIASSLAAVDTNSFSAVGRERLRDELRETISSHRSFSDAEWAMPPPFIDQLKSVYDGIDGGNAVTRNLWLFSSSPKIMNASQQDWDAWQQELAKQRRSAVEEIYSAGGLEDVLRLSGQSKHPEAVGTALASVGLTGEDEEALLGAGLNLEQHAAKDLAAPYALYRNVAVGPSWATGKWAVASRTWNPDQQAQFLLFLPIGQDTWSIVESAGKETEEIYWSKVRPWRFESASDIQYAVAKLKEVGRFYTALDIIGNNMQGTVMPVPIEATAELIEQAYQTSLEEGIQWPLFAHGLSKLMDALEDAEEISNERVATMEWAFMPLLEHVRSPRLLSAELSRNPKFFVDLLTLVFRAEGEEPAENSEENINHARLALDLLEAWRSTPGLHADGSIDANALKEWVAIARATAASSGRGSIGDQYIGHALAFSPVGADGQWPAEAVREIIEDASSEDIERGLEIQVFNNRGVTTRSPYDGGEQERQLERTYRTYADELSDFWPRTAAMLRRIADDYKSEARREDTNVDLEEDLGS